MAFDRVSKGDAYDLWGVVRGLLDQGGGKRLQGGASVVDVTREMASFMSRAKK